VPVNYTDAMLPERVAELMKRHGLTQTQLADVLGVSQQHVSLRLLGRRRFTVADVVMICNYFQCSPGELLAPADVLFTGGL
jgi:transcriptional regulator with XRE-family HTH domain